MRTASSSVRSAAVPELEQNGIWVHLTEYEWHEILGKAWTWEIQERIRDQVRVAAQAEQKWAANARKPITLSEGKRKGKTG